MPTRPPTGCTAPGCPNPSPCPVHPRNSWASGGGKKRPPHWTATRRRILQRDRRTCQQCGAPATEVDHITRGVEADWNLRSLCARCHRAKTLAEAQAARRLAR